MDAMIFLTLMAMLLLAALVVGWGWPNVLDLLALRLRRAAIASRRRQAERAKVQADRWREIAEEQA